MSTSRRIAFIDDDKDLGELVACALGEQGFQVDVYHDAFHALENLQHGWPDLILCDIMMPQMDGFEFVEIFRRRFQAAAHTPVVLVSARENASEALKSKVVGADDFISKPINFKVLAATVLSRIAQCSRISQGAMISRIFQSENSRTRETRDIYRDLCDAIDMSELKLYYQPKIDAAGVVCGAEALARWTKNDGSIVPPNVFIPIAEQFDLIIPLTDSLLHRFTQDFERWHRDGRQVDFEVSLNLSASHLSEDVFSASFESVPVHVARNLSFEVTESSLFKNLDRAIAVIKSAEDYGVKFYIDDFGQGYSSLAHLRDLPVTGVKVDKSFVDEWADDRTGRKLLSNIVSLGGIFDIDVVAEGVEHPEQRDVLIDMGCDELQGFLFSPPVPPNMFAKSFLC
jgi:EAL domain-containing protein (putative c-di-GMP-specific phosphodiesterase class I)/CheY-like chemotaxis protein